MRNYYVSRSGSDAHNGSRKRPWRTLAHAAARAGPGSTVHVGQRPLPGTARPGPQRQAGTAHPASWPSTGGAPRITATSSGSLGIVEIAGDYVDFEGFDISGRGGDGTAGIVVPGSHVRVLRNRVHDVLVACDGGSNGGGGIVAGGGLPDYRNHDIEVVGNLVHDVVGTPTRRCEGVQGIYASVARVLIANNVAYRNAHDCITSWHAATQLTIVNNTAVDCPGAGITIGSGGPGATSSGNVHTLVANNLVYGNGQGIVETTDGVHRVGPGNRFLNNLVFRSGNGAPSRGAVVSGTVSSDPKLASAGDSYRLTAGSPAIDAGTQHRSAALGLRARAPAAGIARRHRSLRVAIAGAEQPVAPVRRAPRAVPLALVMGDVDLVRALGLAGIRVAFFGPADAPARYSRHVAAVLPWIDPWRRQDELVAALIAFARAQREAPILYPQTDAALLLASRRRDELGAAFRLMLADADLVEQLVDKGRFEALARRTGLPVPRAARLRPQLREPPAVPDLAFPLIVKPVVRDAAWASTGEQAKAIRVGGPDEWERLWPRLADGRSEFVVQELVPGPETAIESYHAYVDAAGAIAGRVHRAQDPHASRRATATAPPSRSSTCPTSRGSGARCSTGVGMRGVAKADFKRDERGRLHLLEINPRFTLWEHPAAIAGVNLAALVHADLSGQPRPAGRRPARRVAWCMPLWDARAASAAGVPPRRWLRWALGCEAKSGLSRDDPLPFLRGTLTSAVRRRLPRRRART